ncbi:hypothetical protein PBI_PHANTASTIC_70 [Mycobacterium phage Phantastic]|uniref:Uncharacterized protein n=1 Tax=Mycobacterium phage Phantastic TaxID=1486426 RepID=A0A023W7S2_9CAUD|nr:hypothetical protein FH39_gp29 [Mycobacterium phage Phantastic]AHY27133.1 hypothetical protein PBI_PHANTASTIC_70 [Mycobacterium phage Phantastic]
MRNIQPGMNVAKQRRKITHLIDTAPVEHVPYLLSVLEMFDFEVAHGRPTPASQFIPMYHEEFGL